jgi:PAS domain S-box-containing protein
VEEAMGKHLRDTLLHSGTTFRSVFDQLPDMMWICKQDGRLVEVNSAGVGLLFYDSRYDILSKGYLHSLFHSQKNFTTWQRTMEKQGYVQDFEATLVRKNGSIIPAQITACSIRDEAGRVYAYAGIARDITSGVKNVMDAHKRNVELIDSLLSVRNAQPKLIQQEKLASIGQLAAGIAHELNNPIGFISSNFTSLRSYIQVIKEYITVCEQSLAISSGQGEMNSANPLIRSFRDDKKLDYILGDIEDLVTESIEGVNRITEIVTSLRKFSRIDNETRVESYDINEALESTLVVAKNEIKYVADVEKELSKVPRIECIGSEINQVLLNILINAAQAIESQNRRDRGLIRIRTYVDSDSIYCEIADDGPGIRQGIVSRIFDPFFTTKDAGEGTGLGLNISYDIVVHKHNGELSVRSEDGKGATFIVKLPRIFKPAGEVADLVL